MQFTPWGQEEAEDGRSSCVRGLVVCVLTISRPTIVSGHNLYGSCLRTIVVRKQLVHMYMCVDKRLSKLI